jgi:hypothetical protein
MKTVLLSEGWGTTFQSYPDEINSELGMLVLSEHKTYPVDGKNPREIDLRQFQGCDAMFALPNPSRYGTELLAFLKERTGLPLVGFIWQPFEEYICFEDTFFNEIFPYIKIFDAVFTHSDVESQLYSRLSKKKSYSLGSATKVSLTGFLNMQSRQKEIISCSRFNWNNAYVNAIISEQPGYSHLEFQSENCSSADVEKMKRRYLAMGHDVQFISKTKRKEFLHRLSNARLAVSMEYRHGPGRFLVDCALAGVPCVCSNTLKSSPLFDEISVSPFDISGAERLVKRLCVDDEFHQHIVTRARAVAEAQDLSLEAIARRYEECIVELKGDKK